MVEQNDGTLGIILDGKNKDAIHALFLYFSKCLYGGKSYEELYPGRSFKNGLLIFGPIGCGKTTYVKMMRKGMKQGHTFRFMPCTKAVSDFNRDGDESLDKYRAKVEWCFDDLGAERQGINYGDKANVMCDIIDIRYRLFCDHGIRTHFTTNLIPKVDDNHNALYKAYGDRIWSRIKHMTDFLAFQGGTGMRMRSKPIGETEIKVESTPTVDRSRLVLALLNDGTKSALKKLSESKKAAADKKREEFKERKDNSPSESQEEWMQNAMKRVPYMSKSELEAMKTAASKVQFDSFKPLIEKIIELQKKGKDQ